MNRLPSWTVNKVARMCMAGLFLLTEQISAQQFSVTNWGHKDGLPSTTAYGITQTTDGFLWIGTGDGLIRFDGFQFIQPELPGVGIGSLGQVTAVESTKSTDVLLIGTASGLLISWRGGVKISAMLGSPIEHIEELSDHTLQVETRNKVVRLIEKDFSTISSAPRSEFPMTDASHLAVSKDRTGEQSPAGKALIAISKERALIRKVLRDTSGATWIATENAGLFRIPQNGEVQRYTHSTGLPSDHIWDIFEDREGNIWAGTQNGLSRLRQDKFITYTLRDGLLSDIASSLTPAREDGVWVGSRSGLEHFAGTAAPHNVLLKGTPITGLLPIKDGALLIATHTGIRKLSRGDIGQLQPFPNTAHIEQMAESEAGDLWLYGQQAGLWHSKDNSSLEHINEPSLAGQTITSLRGGQRDQVWLGLENGDVILRPPAGSHIFTSANGLTGGAIRFLSSQPDGTLWVASDNGLAYFDGERFRHWDHESGLPGNRLIWTLPDQRGNLWLGYSTGIARLSVSDLLHTSPETRQLQYDFYDDGDGLKSNPEAYGSGPVALSSDGRLWVSMSEGIGMIDLARMRRNSVAPPVHILGLTADGRSLTPANGLKIAPHTRNLQISYTGISLSEPRKVRFRCRLEGFEPGWQDAGTRRNAFYTNLRPGHYRFRVLAANNDGIWNETGDSISFELLPAFYETLWFLVLCVLLISSFAFVLHRLRVRSAARELQSRFEERMSERTRIAQDLHDNLVQEMMGISLQLEIADEVTPPGSTAKGPLRRALDLSRTALANGRSALHILRQRPFSNADIESTLRDTVQSMTGSQEIIQITSSGKERPIQPLSGEEMVQIVREALRNAIRHAGQNNVVVRSEYGDHYYQFTVHDNGPGVSEGILQGGKPSHFGIPGMRERAARIGAALTVSSSPSTGTQWTLRVPAQIAYESQDRVPHYPLLQRLRGSLSRLSGRKDRR
ncbi:sensor histidine kinase [Tunturiibacter lichenicola]|uniref:sensor histidine kinase n=1 Tax=Tunturiibacter lichenicola TaxID=2051959 RepID=UPI003D9AB611